MIEILGNKVFYNGEETTVLLVEKTVIHLQLPSGEGVCVNITDEQKEQLV